MPFITEELWALTARHRANVADRGGLAGVALAARREAAAAEMHWVIDLIKGVRSVRAEMNVPGGRENSAGA